MYEILEFTHVVLFCTVAQTGVLAMHVHLGWQHLVQQGLLPSSPHLRRTLKAAIEGLTGNCCQH